jgi:hypothetical protein
VGGLALSEGLLAVNRPRSAFAGPLSWLEKQQSKKCSALFLVGCLKRFDRLARI